MERDPNGVAAAIVVIVTAVAAAVGATVDEETVKAVAAFLAVGLDGVAVLVARRKTWAPDSVRALEVGAPLDDSGLPDAPPAERVDAVSDRRRAAKKARRKAA